MRPIIAGALGGVSAAILSRFADTFLMEVVVGLVAGAIVGAIILYAMRAQSPPEV